MTSNETPAQQTVRPMQKSNFFEQNITRVVFYALWKILCSFVIHTRTGSFRFLSSSHF